MRTYKHKTLPYTAKGVEGINYYKIEGQNEHLPAILVENSCDWEEVAEKGYKIHSYLYGNMIIKNLKDCANPEKCRINSVERLKDKKFFTVNSEIVYKDRVYTIEKIYELSGSIMFYVGEGLNIHINNASVFQRPLFKTEDGKQIFEGDSYFVPQKRCDEYSGTILEFTADKDCFDYNEDDSKRFSTKQAAQQFIDSQKILFVTEDNIKVYHEDVFYRVHTTENNMGTYVSWEPIMFTADKNIIYHDFKEIKRFSTEKAAQNYIKMNKPCLSLSEVLDAFDKTVYPVQREPFKKEVTKLVKQKIKNV